MKILQVVPSLAIGFGGPTIAVLGLSAALTKLGQEVKVFTTDADVKGSLSVPLGQPVKQSGFEIYYFPVRYLRHYKFSPRLAEALEREIPSFDIVHIHSLFQYSTFIASQYCRKYRKPYLIRPLGHLDPYALGHRFVAKKLYLELFERKNLDKASAIHFTTEDEMSLAAPLGFKAKPLVIGLGLDWEEFRTLPSRGSFRSRYPQLKDKRIILFFGRINFKKGLDILVDAFKNIAEEKEDTYLVIAGPDDAGYLNKVRGWLRDRHLDERTIFTGLIEGPDKMSLLRDSDIFVLPSHSENFGVAVSEAMACGLPVIVSNRVGLHREISQAGAGLVISANSQELTSALLRLLDNPQAAQDMGQRGRILVEGRFNWQSIAGRMLCSYGDIVKSQRL